jgi:hypothetical protein
LRKCSSSSTTSTRTRSFGCSVMYGLPAAGSASLGPFNRGFSISKHGCCGKSIDGCCGFRHREDTGEASFPAVRRLVRMSYWEIAAPVQSCGCGKRNPAAPAGARRSPGALGEGERAHGDPGSACG